MHKFSNINSIMILTKLFHIPSSNLLDSQNFHFHFTKWKNKKKMHTFRSLHLPNTYWSLRHFWHSWSWYFYPKAKLLYYEWNIKQLLFMLIMNGLHSDHEINSNKVSFPGFLFILKQRNNFKNLQYFLLLLSSLLLLLFLLLLLLLILLCYLYLFIHGASSSFCSPTTAIFIVSWFLFFELICNYMGIVFF